MAGRGVGCGATDPFTASHRIHAQAIANISFNSGFLLSKNAPQACLLNMNIEYNYFIF